MRSGVVSSRTPALVGGAGEGGGGGPATPTDQVRRSRVRWIYHLVANVVTPALSWGPPTYQGQVWIAGATLAFTFPLLATHADFFDHWPLRTATPVEVDAEGEELSSI